MFKSNFKNYFGQITKDTDIGRWIVCLSSLSTVKNIVEIGTWNGAGSSKLIALGVKSSLVKYGECKVISIEIDREKIRTAKKNLKKYDFFTVLHGRVIESEDLDTTNLAGLETSWLQQDLANLQDSPNVLKQLPNKIDLLVLDGGEFSTFAEFKVLGPRVTQYIILDDTFTKKCRKILQVVKNSKEFEVIFESSERNGVAVLFRKLN
jgi:tRNA A58 N-methylase Trm61